MSEPSPQPLVRVEDVTFTYETGVPGTPPALRDVSLDIRAGELIALIGENGSGKTTLARHLNGLLRPTAGRVLLEGSDARGVPVGMLARKVGYVFQNPDHQLFLPTVRREIAYGPQQLGLTGDALAVRVDETLERFGLAAIAEHHPAQLGRGMRRLTALAAIYALGPRVLVLDEPTGGLDRRLTAWLMALLTGLTTPAAGSHAIVLITHEMALVATHARRIVALRDGEVVTDTIPAEFFDDAAALERAAIDPPPVARVARALRPLGIPAGVNDVESFLAAWKALATRERVR